jgi:chromosome segregation ATPase
MCEEAMGRVPTETERLQAEAESYVTAVEAALERARVAEAEVERLRAEKQDILRAKVEAVPLSETTARMLDAEAEVKRLRADRNGNADGRIKAEREVERLTVENVQLRELDRGNRAEVKRLREEVEAQTFISETLSDDVERLQTLLNGFCPHCNAHLPTYGGPRALAEEKE